MSDQGNSRNVNFFRPLSGLMAREVRLIILLLALCLLGLFVSQFGILFLEKSEWGYMLTEYIFFNLPIHYWITGQFLPLWFVLVGIAFNLWMDHNESRYSNAIRYRAKGRPKGELE